MSIFSSDNPPEENTSQTHDYNHIMIVTTENAIKIEKTQNLPGSHDSPRNSYSDISKIRTELSSEQYSGRRKIGISVTTQVSPIQSEMDKETKQK